MRFYRRREQVLSVLLVLPSVLALFAFVYGFIGWTGYVSLSNWNRLVPDYTFVGWTNYQRLLQNPRFLITLRNLGVFTGLFVGGSVVLGFLLAVLLDRRVRAEGFFRTVYLYPLALSFIVTGVVWRWLLNPGSPQMGSTGINRLLELMGLGFLKSGWYTDPRVGIIAVAVAAIWQMSGYVMAMYLAGLRGIPEELREAARVDGASELQIYRYVVLPLLRPITFGALIVLGHISLKIYDLVVAMTGTGPGFSCDVPAYFMWETTFRANRFGQGAGIAVILLLIVSLLIVPYLRLSLRREVEV
ncbi:MAG: sugar ABC transporter permease [Candidatus Bipolaricaulota bacterium]|nr:sugar ABC transporter permease [Candidatus Bipolaricaulota bacterium]MCX7844142.1 sugar ABC transporter permease [Candidatus Bipolaricaulota bacterium]MDW8152269.1 sugar ABC transporter permease [Candidatus Bipolaricaulota bacterium]